MSEAVSITDIRPGAVIAVMKTVVSVQMNADLVIVSFDDGSSLSSAYDGALVVERRGKL